MEQVAGLAAGRDDARKGTLLLDDDDMQQEREVNGPDLSLLTAAQRVVESGEQVGQGTDGAGHGWSLSITRGKKFSE
jgi:hypothetical protein